MMIALPPTIFVTPRKWSKPQSDPFNRATQAVDDPYAKRRPQLLQILQQLPFASKDHVQLLRNLQQLRRPPSVTYHRAATARDRDKLRQMILEGLGWKLHRIWSTDWWHNSDAQVEKLIKSLRLLHPVAAPSSAAS